MKRNDGFFLRNIGGQDLLVPLGARVVDLNGVIVFNATGLYIWELLAQDRSLDDLAAAVGERFEVEPERARIDIRAFVAEIAKWGGVET